MATLFTWLSRLNRAKFLGLLLVTGTLWASDEVPGYSDIYRNRAIERLVESYAPGYNPHLVAHLPSDSEVRMEVERRHQQLLRNRESTSINTCVQVIGTAILLAIVFTPMVYVNWFWKPNPTL